MRLERLAPLGRPRPCLLAAPALLIAANLGVASLNRAPEAPPPERSDMVAHQEELARVSTRQLAVPPMRTRLDERLISRINPHLVSGEPASRKAVNKTPPPPPPPPPPPVPPTSPTLPVDSVWRSLSMCESSGNWQSDSGNGYYGGLQISLSSWQAVGGVGYPHEQPADIQIAMAERLQTRQGWGAWPACADQLNLG